MIDGFAIDLESGKVETPDPDPDPDFQVTEIECRIREALDDVLPITVAVNWVEVDASGIRVEIQGAQKGIAEYRFPLGSFYNVSLDDVVRSLTRPSPQINPSFGSAPKRPGNPTAGDFWADGDGRVHVYSATLNDWIKL